MARSLNRVQLIGNLTADPELRYTPQGIAVASFSIATNRTWTTGDGEKKESAQFHRIVAWSKLAEICDQYLAKGKKVYVEGRLETREWTDKQDVKKYTTEIIINDMILLGDRNNSAEGAEPQKPLKEQVDESFASSDSEATDENGDFVAADDIPF
jgi:single-strand DNA-binding protein